ncbi:hypothetical protein [Monoglobus pectinilyticus]|jgi:hypothetical protein|uniref:hypothetical protein n=1 Tax=Monoglobus pectinilyticus TaxID=1981510 RepID=UPI000C82900C|nr:hypothetical protein [Monoglobus pectinilyticus]PWL83898.1 MAG: hypothetical protein DBY15_03035 [Clostridiales bacterium]
MIDKIQVRNQILIFEYIILRQVRDEVLKMFRKRPCCKKKNSISILGPVLVALGVGVFLAQIIPTYLLIALFGIALICAGVKFICK